MAPGATRDAERRTVHVGGGLSGEDAADAMSGGRAAEYDLHGPLHLRWDLAVGGRVAVCPALVEGWKESQEEQG